MSELLRDSVYNPRDAEAVTEGRLTRRMTQARHQRGQWVTPTPEGVRNQPRELRYEHIVEAAIRDDLEQHGFSIDMAMQAVKARTLHEWSNGITDDNRRAAWIYEVHSKIFELPEFVDPDEAHPWFWVMVGRPAMAGVDYRAGIEIVHPTTDPGYLFDEEPSPFFSYVYKVTPTIVRVNRILEQRLKERLTK